MIRMKKREIFNKLYERGISYQNYVDKSVKYQEKMDANYNAAQNAAQKLTEDQTAQMNEKLRVLCIAERWCIDCANGVPIIAVISNLMTSWDFRITSRDEWIKEFDTFYSTAGRKKIPVIIFADEDGDEIVRWIERPTRSYQLLGKLKDQNLSKEEFIQKFTNTLEFHPPFVTKEIFSELVFTAEKAASIVQVNPPSRKNSK